MASSDIIWLRLLHRYSEFNDADNRAEQLAYMLVFQIQQLLMLVAYLDLVLEM